MADTFDPYHEWLGIPASEQPPNHYRLLAIPAFEDSPTVIESAADRQMTHLRTFQAGKHSQESQRLLNEVATARVCLLNASKKAAYDQQLKKSLQKPQAPPTPPPLRGRALRRAEDSQETAAFDPKLHPVGPGEPASTATVDLPKLGEYRLLEKLGEGGMGTVYKALHTKLDRVVAIKMLPKGRLEDAQAIARFEREMKAVGAVDDPTGRPGHDAREVGGVRLLVDGVRRGVGPGRDVARCGPLSVADACELARQGAVGLAVRPRAQAGAPGREAVEPDAQPAGAGEDCSTWGWRSLRRAGGEEEMTGAGPSRGHHRVHGPGVFRREGGPDIRADIYALGCTLFKLLTGRTPFSGAKGAAAMMAAHVRQAPPRLDRLRPDVPKELVRIVERMLAKHPDKRYASPGEVAEALKGFCVVCDLRRLLAGGGFFRACPRRCLPKRRRPRPSAQRRLALPGSCGRRGRSFVGSTAIQPAAKSGDGRSPWSSAALPRRRRCRRFRLSCSGWAASPGRAISPMCHWARRRRP